MVIRTNVTGTVIRINIKGLKEVKKFMAGLNPRMKKEVGENGTLELAKDLRARIRRRYTLVGYGKSPFASGMGWKSIQYRDTTNGAEVIVGVDAPWVVRYLEGGFPPHAVSANIIELHKSNPGATMGKTAEELGLLPYEGKPIWSRWKGPFVEPAMQAFIPQIPQILTPYVTKAIRGKS